MIYRSKSKELIRKVFILILYVFQTGNAVSQDLYDITFDDPSIKMGIHLSPNGYGLFYRNVIPKNKSVGHVFDICMTGIRHYKEKSILNQRVVNTTPYIYGKVNRLYVLRPMYGWQITMAEKQTKNSIGVNVFGCLGPSIGFLKPVFVDVETIDPNSPNSFISVATRYDPSKLNPNRITGYSGFRKGLGSTRILGAISFKTGVEFNWGYYSSEFKSLEIGILLDYFPSRPELMYHIKNKIIYSSFYVSFAIGKNY